VGLFHGKNVGKQVVVVAREWNYVWYLYFIQLEFVWVVFVLWIKIMFVMVSNQIDTKFGLGSSLRLDFLFKKTST